MNMTTKKDSYSAQKKIKLENRNKILTALLKSPSTFTQLKEKTELSPMGLSKHIHELEELKQINLTIHERKRVYVVTEKFHVENLIVDRLMKHVGFIVTYQILEASSRGKKEVHVEATYNSPKFINQFIEKTFNLANIDHKTLLEAFKKKYGEATI